MSKQHQALMMAKPAAGGGGATWSFVAASASITSAANPIAVLPTGVTTGDLLVLFAVGGDIGNNYATPTGWTVGILNYGIALLCLWYKIAGASEGSVTLPNGGGAGNRAGMVAYRGIAASPLDVKGSGNTGTSIQPTGVSLTTTVNHDLVIDLYSNKYINTNARLWATEPTGTSKRVEKIASTTENGIFLVDADAPSAGATTVRRANLGSSNTWWSFTIAFKQA